MRISLREFHAWLAYLKLEPPEEGENQRTAALLAQITNMAGRSLPGKKTVKPEEFMPKKAKQRQTAEEQLAFMQSLTRKKEDGS